MKINMEENNKTKVILIELFHHHECIEYQIDYYEKKKYQVKIIFGEYIFNKIKNNEKYKDKCYIINQPNREDLKKIQRYKLLMYIISQFNSYIKNINLIKNIINKEKPDILHISTVESPFAIPLILFLLKIENTKINLVIHNTNRLKISIIKYIGFDFLINKLIKKANNIILLGEYLKFENLNIQKKVIYFNNRLILYKKSEKFEKKTFVISGNLNTNEKNIENILKEFKILLEKNVHLKDKIELVILTKISKEITEMINKYKIKHIVKTYNTFVSEKEFETVMLKSHYLIISVYENSIYGKYKISGSFGDGIGFNLPILLNEHYAPDFKNKSIIRYKNNGLNLILKKLMNK